MQELLSIIIKIYQIVNLHKFTVNYGVNYKIFNSHPWVVGTYFRRIRYGFGLALTEKCCLVWAQFFG